MLEDAEKFGLKTLDALLGGGITPGSSILIVSDHQATGKQYFSSHFATEILKSHEDSHVFNVVYSYPVHQVFVFFTDPLIQKAIHDRKFSIINCYGITSAPEQFKEYSITNLDNPNDVNKLRYLIGTIREEKCGIGCSTRWIFDDITNMVITIGSEDRVLQFLREMFYILKTYGDLGLFYVDRTAHSPKFVSSLENMVETVIYLTVKEVSSVLVPHLRCVKNRFFGEELISYEVPYTLQKGKIVMQSDIFDNFESIKKNLIIQPKGTIELFDSEYILTTRNGLINNIKSYYDSVNYDTFRKVSFDNGREMGIRVYQNFVNKIRTNSKTALNDLTKLFNSLGLGMITVQKLDLEKGVAIVHGRDLFYWKGAVRPIHAELGGVFAGVNEMVTGEPWEFIETRCNATGDEFCEFLGGPLRELAPVSQDIMSIKKDLEITREGELILRGTRILLMPRGTLMNIVEAVEDITNRETAKEILYHAGEKMAMQLCDLLSSKYNLQGIAIIRAYAQMISTRGWGLVEIKDIDLEKGMMKALVKKSLIGTRKHLEPESQDYIPAGVFAGIMEYITKMKLICEEIKCVAKGDNVCEFIVRPYETTSKTVL